MENGYIKLSRKFFDNKIWQAARAFSECEAWLDLIQSARFEASPTTSRIGCYEVTWGRGQYPASVRFLAKKWGRSERWTRTLIGKLKRNGMVSVDESQGISVITLINYEKYNEPNSTPIDIPTDTPNGIEISKLKELVTHLVTQQMTHLAENRHTSDTNTKKGEEYNLKETPSNEGVKKDAAIAATLSRKEKFRQSLVPFVEKYGKDMMKDFFDYWSEMNKSCTKMRFEQQPTWEVAKRLATWAKRDRSYGKSNHSLQSVTTYTGRFTPQDKIASRQSLEDLANAILEQS